jgi:hypothetical protein
MDLAATESDALHPTPVSLVQNHDHTMASKAGIMKAEKGLHIRADIM